MKTPSGEQCQSPAICRKILRMFYYKPEIDLFASSLKYQIPKYVSLHSDKNAVPIDTFSISWSNLNFNAFSPFCVIGEVVAKIRQEQYSVIMVMP